MNLLFSLPASDGHDQAGATIDDTQVDQELSRWHDLVAQMGRELAEPLTTALERVTTLATTGRIDRQGLRALQAEISRARLAGIACQQIARLASGRAKQAAERIHLTHTVQSALAYRARELQGQGIQLTQSLVPVEVLVDPASLFALLNVMVDWWLDCAKGQVELRIDLRTWPERARLCCRFAHQPPDVYKALSNDEIQAQLHTLHWHLLAQNARSMGLDPALSFDSTHAELTLEFPHTVRKALASTLDLQPAQDASGFADSLNSKPLAGSHVLVVAARRDLRVQMRESLKTMGLVLDFVGSVKEAAEFCREGLPHAMVFEGGLRSPALDQVVASIRREVPEFVFIEITDDSQGFDISSVSPTGMARVGRTVVDTALPSALVYELSRIM